MPRPARSRSCATAAARYPVQCVMLPTMPGGHAGDRFGPGGIATSGRPSVASARRAQYRPVVYSRRRLSTARATAGSSSGYRTASGGPSNASAASTDVGRISSSTSGRLPGGRGAVADVIVTDMRKYVIMGVQGSGKGTQAGMLAADLDLVHMSVGDIFRWHVQQHTKLGAQVRRVMAAGELVGDDLVESVVRDRLTQHDWNFGFIIDGFPRNRRQAEFFLESYDIDGVIVLDLPDSEVRRRVLNRRLCADCGMDYHLIDSSPKVPGQCDSCGGELVTREDDTEEALAVRLRDYHEKTDPVIELFRRKEYVFTVDARSAPDAVQEQIRTCLGVPPMTARKSRQPGAAGA